MEMKWYIGIDIGGTKSAVILIDDKGNIRDRKQISTTTGKNNWKPTIDYFVECITEYVQKQQISSIGISCGGPLDSIKGIICSPPNLPGWDDVPIVKILSEKIQIPVALENDANAGALAEWRYGAGKGYNNMIFLTFGTGLGAGLILNGKLYSGTNDFGGEAGHIRLDSDGPIGYNKRGSFEGFCSGTGISQMMAFELFCLREQVGEQEMLKRYKEPLKITGKDVVEWAKAEDELAMRVINQSGNYFGKGLAILIDILNPELIVVGSMAVRLGDLLLKPAREIIQQEALPGAAAACKIVPAGLGEQIGDFAALCVAIEATDISK